MAGIRKRLFAKWYTRLTARYETYIRETKERMFHDLPSTIVEIGPGTGANLKYLPPGCRWIGIEPNPHMHAELRERADAHSVDAEFRMERAGRIDLPDASADAAISTHVLCSVADPDQVLAEVHRVLKPGGRFLFIEHVAAPHGTWLGRSQRALRPLWRLLTDGCHLDRDTASAIERVGFQSVTYDRMRLPYPPMPPIVSPHVLGEAVK